MIISCLHTADSNVAVFENAARELGLSSANLRHTVRADLLRAAEEAGGLTEDITQQTAAVLSALAAKADAVLLTCSTLGPSVVRAGLGTAVPILRAVPALSSRFVSSRVRGRCSRREARDGYLAAIARAAEAAYGDGASIVALAQASMAGAADHVRNGPQPLSSPAAGLKSAVNMIAH